MRRVTLSLIVLGTLLACCTSITSAADLDAKLAATLFEKAYGQQAAVEILGLYKRSDTEFIVFVYFGAEKSQHDYQVLKLTDGRWVLGRCPRGNEFADCIRAGFFVK